MFLVSVKLDFPFVVNNLSPAPITPKDEWPVTCAHWMSWKDIHELSRYFEINKQNEI